MISKEEFELIAQKIKALLKGNPSTANSLFGQLREFKKEKVWKVLHYLETEKEIMTDREGCISA